MTVHTVNKCGGFKRKHPDASKSEQSIKNEPKEKILKLKKSLSNIAKVE